MPELFYTENETFLTNYTISCGIHIAIGICCPRKNCWPGFIKGANEKGGGDGDEEDEDEENDLKGRSGSNEVIQDAIVAATAAANAEDQTQTTEM